MGIEIVKEIYVLTEKFPKEELYGLTIQMRCAAISIPSNIAEGFKRRYHKEYKQFLHIVFGSAAELETQPVIAKELGFIYEVDLSNILENRSFIKDDLRSLQKTHVTMYEVRTTMCEQW